MTPARMLRTGVIVYLLLHAMALFLLAGLDAQGKADYFRLAVLASLWASVSFTVGLCLSIRRRWLGEPAQEIADEVLPAIGVFVIGWAIWTAAHHVF